MQCQSSELRCSPAVCSKPEREKSAIATCIRRVKRTHKVAINRTTSHRTTAHEPAHQRRAMGSHHPQILSISPTMPSDSITISRSMPPTYSISCVVLKSSSAGRTAPFVAPFPLVRACARSAARFSDASAMRVRGSEGSYDWECLPLPRVTSLTNDG